MLEDKLSQLIKEYKEIEEKLCSGNILPNTPEYTELLKKYNMLTPIAKLYTEYEDLKNQLEEVKSISSHEIKELIIDESKILQEKIKTCYENLKKALLDYLEPESGKNVIFEIRSGTGGLEASLFVADLLKMYLKYFEKKGMKYEFLSSAPTELNGFKEVILYVSGKNVYNILKNESGVHRVQRIPVTESSGRIHTSTATVAVLPEPEEVDIKINEKDLKIETFRSSGPGGQHMQKTESAVRITHLPSNITVECQESRSQLKNKEKAMKILKAKLYDLKIKQQIDEISNLRKQQIKDAERPQKIRTYNFPQNRVTDHRLNYTVYNLKEVLNGEIDEFIERLILR